MNGFIKQAVSDAKPEFGIMFDIDGVIALGANPIPEAVEGLKELTDGKGNFILPVAFVTNGCNLSADKAKEITRWTGINVEADQVMHAQSPLKTYRHYHECFTLFVGQGDLHAIAKEIGFDNICTIDQIKEAYPLLDVVDHKNRKVIATGFEEKSFPAVECIVILGEPDRWDTFLQLLVDLLLTNGKPNETPKKIPPSPQIPMLACNMDLVFMAQACMPRYGNGAFLVCLEALYKKVTGKALEYTGLIGKPSEVTYRFAEHVLSEQAIRLSIKSPLKRMYLVGDNPDVDIVGSNIYDRYIHHIYSNTPQEDQNLGQINGSPNCPRSRIIPETAQFTQQTVRHLEGLLVGTGVYSPDAVVPDEDAEEKPDYSHRDFEMDSCLTTPTKFFDNARQAIEYALEKEKFPILNHTDINVNVVS